MNERVNWLRTLVFQYNAAWIDRGARAGGNITVTIEVQSRYKIGRLKRPLRVWLRSNLQRESQQRWDEPEHCCRFRVSVDLQFTTLSAVLPRRRNKQPAAAECPFTQEIPVKFHMFVTPPPMLCRRTLERFAVGLS